MLTNTSNKPECMRGSRKSSVASCFLGKKEIIVNNKSLKEYFKQQHLIDIALTPIGIIKTQNQNFEFFPKISLKGGGIHAQAEACRYAVARFLAKLYPEYKEILKGYEWFQNDTRSVQTKTPGRPKARRGSQSNKR